MKKFYRPEDQLRDVRLKNSAGQGRHTSDGDQMLETLNADSVTLQILAETASSLNPKPRSSRTCLYV